MIAFQLWCGFHPYQSTPSCWEDTELLDQNPEISHEWQGGQNRLLNPMSGLLLTSGHDQYRAPIGYY